MLGAVRDVANGLMKDIGEEVYFSLENITKAVEAYSAVDHIYYVEYDVPAHNPICGQFRKYGFAPAAYASAQVVVEVRYAKHLTLPWRRFVVAKELCHSL